MTETTTPTIEELEAAVAAAQVELSQIEGDYFEARNALFDAHNAAVQAMDATYQNERPTAAQTLTAAQKSLNDALNPPAPESEPEPATEPEDGE